MTDRMTTNTPSEQPAIPEGAGAEEMRELIAGILWADDPANHQSGMTLDSDEVALLAKHFCGPIEQPAQASEVDDNDSPEARLDMVRVVLRAIAEGADAIPLAKAGLDFCDLTQAEREVVRGEVPALNPSQERAEVDHG